MIRGGLFIVAALFGIALPGSELLAQKEEKAQDVLLHPDRFYKKFFPKLKIKRNPPDSAFIKTYPNYLSVGMHILSPSIGINVSSRSTAPAGIDPTSKFRTNIADVIGFSGTYRFVAIGFSFLSNSGINKHNDYGPSHYRTATVKYNSGGLALQFKYLRIQGFTDINQPDWVDPRQRNTRRPDILDKEFQFEGIYNFSWKKYSYTSPLTFAQRQIRSHAGFLVKAGVYYDRLSGDSTIINPIQQQYYHDFDGVKAIQTLSIKIAPGAGGNLVFLKYFYLSAAAFASADLYYYKYLQLPVESASAKRAFVFALDGKASLGYQSRRFYAGLRYEAEQRIGTLQSIHLNSFYTYAGFELGYRFNTPGFVKKVYKKTMPPGM